MSASLNFALAYADLGWPVLPVMPGTKKPWNGLGIEHATTDRQAIAGWYAAEPQAGVGIRLDAAGLVAVDIDPRNGGLLELADDLPRTLTAKTPSGGLHLVYRTASGDKFPGTLRKGVDLKHKGYIIVEPTRRSEGAYHWQDFDVLAGEIPEIAAAPRELLGKPQKAPGQRKTPPPSQATVGEGGRNDLLSAQAFKLRKQGHSIPVITAALLEMNRESCRPPLPEDEVRAIAMGKTRIEPDPVSIALEDFYAYLPGHQYLFAPTGELWPGASVNGQCTWPKVDGKVMTPSAWLDKHRPLVQIGWAPGEPTIIEDRVMQDTGYAPKPGARVFNKYRAPSPPPGRADRAGLWIEHVRRLYPDNAEHIIKWLAHRVQRPAEKINHALVLGGAQGIGKDTLLDAVRPAIGLSNWQEIGAAQMTGRFTGWTRCVICRVSEARDLGDIDRFKFYDLSKTYITAPPDVLRVDEKHLRETYVQNVMGVIITTNHASNGLYLPADDRRHYVAWSPRTRDDFESDYFQRLWTWINGEGAGHVAAYLGSLDLTGFDPKAPPAKTPAFWQMVASGDAAEAGELRDVIEAMGSPAALTINALILRAEDLKLFDLVSELKDRRGRRTLPSKLERAGYSPVRNPDADDGLFRIEGRRVAVYSQSSLPFAEQLRAARGVTK